MTPEHRVPADVMAEADRYDATHPRDTAYDGRGDTFDPQDGTDARALRELDWRL